MIRWLGLTDAQRKATIDAAEQQSGITAKAIEKDWWVTLTLRALFQGAYHNSIVFKGGTSLSKGWNLIARFSEDIDIALNPQVFGVVYAANPSGGFVTRLKRQGCEFTSNELRNDLEAQLALIGVPGGMVQVIANPVPENRPDTDPQTLLVRYPSLYDPNEYIADEVKVEVSVRSQLMPSTAIQVQSFLDTYNPNPAFQEQPFTVEIVQAHKTFLEKIFLLHEEFGKPERDNIRTERMSRHLYDLYKMMHTDILDTALGDHALYDHLIEHRQQYNRITGIDYQTHHHSTVSFIPIPEVLEEYRNDYRTMQEQMIYEEAADFDDIIADLKFLQGRIRMKMQPRSLNAIIEAAINQIGDEKKVAGATVETAVVITSDPFQQPSPINTSVIYSVKFITRNGHWQFEAITIQ